MRTAQAFLIILLLAAGLSPSSAGEALAWVKTEAPLNYWSSLALTADGAKLFAAAQLGGTGGGIYVSSDGGATWDLTTAPTTNWWCGLACSDTGERVVAVAGWSSDVGPVFLSTNSGLDWAQAPLPATNWSSVACSVDGAFMIAGSSRTLVCTSTNSGATWLQSVPEVGSFWASVACSADGSKAFAAGRVIYMSTNYGASWYRTDAPSTTWNSVSCSADGQFVCASALDGFYYSRDGGVSWTNSQPRSTWTHATCAADSSSALAFFISTPMISTNACNTWDAYPAPHIGWSAAACTRDGTKFAIAGRGDGIYIWRMPVPLSLEISDLSATVSWADEAAANGLQLESTSNLNGTDWVVSTTSPLRTNGGFQVKVPLLQGAAFYRLIGR